MIKYHRGIDWKYTKKAWIPAVPSSVLAVIIYVALPVGTIQLIYSSFLLIWVIFQYRKNKLKKNIHSNPLETSHLKHVHPLIFYPGYLAYGFIGGLTGAAGPINVMILEERGYQKEEFIANFTAVNFPKLILTLSLYLYFDLFPLEYLWLWIIGFPFIFIAVRIGYYINSKIDVKTFQLLILITLTAIGLNMFIQGYSTTFL